MRKLQDLYRSARQRVIHWYYDLPACKTYQWVGRHYLRVARCHYGFPYFSVYLSPNAAPWHEDAKLVMGPRGWWGYKKRMHAMNQLDG